MKCNTVSVIKILKVLLIFVFVQICTEIMEIKLMLLLLHLWGTIFTYKFVLNFLSLNYFLLFSLGYALKQVSTNECFVYCFALM